MEYAYYPSPLGTIEIGGDREAIRSLDFIEKECKKPEVPSSLKEAVQQLDEYFRGVRKEFSVNLIFDGTVFQNKVWQALTSIPFGKTISYRELAEQVGEPNAFRAVGNANGKNKICIFIPCHRVISQSGKLGGYTSGLSRKQWLLEHEKKVSQKSK